MDDLFCTLGRSESRFCSADSADYLIYFNSYTFSGLYEKPD